MTNHLMSSNSHPSSTAKKQYTASNEREVTKSTETSYNVDNALSGAPDGRFEKLFFARDAFNFDKMPTLMIMYL